MKKFNFKNATVYICGNISKERLENATIRFAKGIRKCEALKRKENA